MIVRFWLVKFPRGKRTDPRNRQVLKNEAPYLEVARQFGLRTGTALDYENETLFVPRFDRAVDGSRVIRYGMHSLYALAGVPGFGASVRHEVYCRALARFVSDPAAELREYIQRDVLNLALRNTDNHGRNSAVLRKDGQIALSPIYDLAPMFLDPEGINRVTRWEDERPGNQPEWASLCEKLGDILPSLETRAWLAALAERVKSLPETMERCRVDGEIIERLARWIDDVARALAAAKP